MTCAVDGVGNLYDPMSLSSHSDKRIDHNLKCLFMYLDRSVIRMLMPQRESTTLVECATQVLMNSICQELSDSQNHFLGNLKNSYNFI